jgi:hypothetical protein
MPICPECGAELADNAECRRLFDALLLLERDSPSADEAAHFLAVASYVLQHPDTMEYTAAALQGVRESVQEFLRDEASLTKIRLRTRAANNGSQRVTRRAGDVVHSWGNISWPINVAYVLAGGSLQYPTRVREWAEAVVAALHDETK